MNSANFFAVDLGATSGRTILGTVTDGKMKITEISRFPNRIIRTGGHCFWDIFALYEEIINGLSIIAKEGIEIESIGIDTWGVDFVCIGKDGLILRNPHSYRDTHTDGVLDEYFKVVPKERLYELTGIQFMNFNSLFQLFAMRRDNSSALEAADKILFMPDALSYLLTGNMVTESTIASTSQMVNPRTGEFEAELLETVGLDKSSFGRLVKPGDVVGVLSEEVQKLTGLGAVPVVAVAGHDTASAVAAVPAKNENFAFLSSGTWSLMGIEVNEPIINEKNYEDNFTNEGGIEGTTDFLKNICGMWLLERCRAEWKACGEDHSYAEIMEAAVTAPSFGSIINPDAPCFANPESMISAIGHYCKATEQSVPQSYGEISRCIFDSLALRYRQIFKSLEAISPKPIECLHVIGGGAQNSLLNQFTCNAVGVPVVAGPSEGTSIGNVLIQAKAHGDVADVSEMRTVIKNSIVTKSFMPTDEQAWSDGYEKYLKVYRTDI